MSLPFRRRHHDAEGSHDRARSLASRELIESLEADEAGWLARHLDACTECRQDRAAFMADRELLRGLRDERPEPPRDLWARTAASLDREARRRPHKAGARAAPRSIEPPPRRSAWRALPLGAAAGALIVMIVIGASWVRPIPPPGATLSASAVALPSVVPGATPINVAAAPVRYLRVAADGSWEVVVASVDEVCPRNDPDCVPDLNTGPGQAVNLGSRPSNVTLSPRSDRLVVEDPGDESHPGRIVVVPLESAGTEPTPPPASQAPGSLDPSASPTVSSDPTPLPTPPGQIEIASGVTVVGDVAYSEDETWLAFSAMPSDGSTGPDLYLWSVGQPTALPVTTDHATFFSAWHGNLVLASRLDVPGGPGASPEPSVSPEPGASPQPGRSTEPGRPSKSPKPGKTPEPSIAPSVEPSAAASASAPPASPVEAHAVSFILDPATLARRDLDEPDVWLPVVDPTGASVAYWSGTVRSTDGLTWELGTGEVLLDGWLAGTPAAPHASGAPTMDPGAASPDPSALPQPAIGPAGHATAIVPGTIEGFKARFDPTGTRLAVWVSEDTAEPVGRLHLIVIDGGTSTVDPMLTPLPGTPALRKFSIEDGRLAWITPDGQDGNASAVRVLAWQDDDFGEIEAVAGEGGQILP